MPRYFFTIRSGTEEASDPEGQCFPDLDAARTEAIGSAREIAADRVRFGKPLYLDARFEITDEEGRALLTVVFREAVVLRGL